MITHIHICQQLDKPFKIWKSELYCTIAQCLLWKKLYKWPTKLYCDNATYQVFKSLDILEIWDEIDTDLLNQTTSINKTRFWSSGKLLVMNSQTKPYMMSDLDFVNFTDMFQFNLFNGYDLGVYHKELWFMNSAYAKPREKLKEVDFKPKQKLNFWANPFNMGSFYMGDMNLNKEYTERRNLLVSELNKMEGVFCPNPGGAFYAVVRLPIDDSDKFCQWMLESFAHENQTVMMAPATGFYSTPGAGKNEVRLAYVLNKTDLAAALTCIAEALKVYPGKTN